MGDDGSVPFQVVEDEVIGAIAPLLPRRQSINGKLQTFIGIFLRLSFSRFVVGDDDVAAGHLIDAIDTTHDFYVAHLHIEELFGVEHFGLGSPPKRSEKIV